MHDSSQMAGLGSDRGKVHDLKESILSSTSSPGILLQKRAVCATGLSKQGCSSGLGPMANVALGTLPFWLIRFDEVVELVAELEIVGTAPARLKDC